jgi:pyruvate,water dikinase
MRALGAYLEAMEGAEGPAAEANVLSGLAVSGGVHEGTARVCASAADLDRIRAGDVLVAVGTTPAINIVLPMLGAIVTDRGGALSHAAIVCREFGIPGVVGTRTATKTIRDGGRVRVDGNRGVVSVLA